MAQRHEQDEPMQSAAKSRCIWHENCTLPLSHLYTDHSHNFTRTEEEKELIKLHDEVDKGILSGDPRHPNLLRLLSPGFQAQHDRHSTTDLMDIYEFMDLVCKLQETYFHDKKLETFEAWVDFEDVPGFPKGSFATVWQIARVNMYKEGVVRDSLLLSKWQRQNDNPETNWLCYRTGALSSAPLVMGQMGI